MNEIFSENLRRLRQSKGYTQEQAGAHLGVSAKAVSRWERGSTLPDVLLLPAIAEYYCVTVDDLFRAGADSYENYACRLLAVYSDTREQEDFIRAEGEFRRLFDGGARSSGDLRSYGVLHEIAMMECADRALLAYNEVISRGPEGDGAVYRRTRLQRIHLLSHMGRDDLNISRQEQAIRERPHDPWEYVLALGAYCYGQRYEQAEALFRAAVEKFPGQSELYVYGADACRHLGRMEEAIAILDSSLELDPDLFDARYAKGDCYEQMGDWARALEVWEELARLLEAKGFTIEAEEPRRAAEKCRAKL